MNKSKFSALLLEQVGNGVVANVRSMEYTDLPDAGVTVGVECSSLNYKDGLAITGKGRIVKNYPMIPGIDLAGTVIDSRSGEYKPGDKVVATGWGMGESWWGGMAQAARLKPEWLTPLEVDNDTRWAMTIGTAGLTAMLCIMAIEESGILPQHGEIAVSGASGGVGSTSVAILSKLGYSVVAITGSKEHRDYLMRLGADSVVDRSDMQVESRPLEKQRWAGAVDTCGDNILARLLAETKYGGAVAACGLVAGHNLKTTVMPFILRGVSLIGVDSVYCPRARRLEAWRRLGECFSSELASEVTAEISLSQVVDYAYKIVSGEVTGRTLIDVNKVD